MPLILSTKILSSKLKRHLFAAGIGLVEYDAVKIAPVDISFAKNSFDNAIFTSQNAVKLAMETHNLAFNQLFCVGEKTANLLQKYDINPKFVAKDGKDLALQILEKHPNHAFDFFCSQQRRDELPDILKQYNIQLKEYHLYESVCNFKTFPNQFDAVLCFSPLGVKAYYECHNKQTLAICIGNTTAEAAKEYTPEVLMANKTSVESVIIKAIRNFR